MRIIKTIAVLLIGASIFLTACGGTSGGSPSATTPAANSPPAMDMTPATGQPVAAASFTTSNLTVTPDKAMMGDRVMVGVMVTNTGTQQGTYTVMVKDHDGTLLGTKDVTLAGGAKENVTLHVSMNSTGTHMIMIDKLYQNLVIQDAAPAPIVTAPTQPGTGPAAFTLSNLTLPSGMLMPDDKLTIGVTVTNTGGQSGTYKVVLKVQDNQTRTEDVQTQDVTLADGASQKVTFSVTTGLDGTYTVTIDKLTGTLVVDEHGGM